MFKDLKPGLQMLILDKSATPMKCLSGKVVKVYADGRKEYVL